jgi:hypothetical protein
MGNVFRRIANFVNNIYREDEIIYSRELQISLPVSQNDIYKENNIENKIENNIDNSYISKEYNDIDLKKSTNVWVI